MALGGMMGGALTGGLDGGGMGALIGAGMGGVLGGIGGFGIEKFGPGFGVGMLVAGAGVAGGTDNLDSFAGGLTGGYLGVSVGNGVTGYSEQHLSNKNPTEGPMAGKDPSENGEWRMLGIGTTDSRAQAVANSEKAGYPSAFYTKSRGIVADLVRSGMQKVFGNSLASQEFAAGYLRGAAPGTNIYAHSEGTLTLAGAIKALNVDGVKVAVNISWNAPVIAGSTATNLSQSIGATSSYHLGPADPIGVFTTLNPAKQAMYGVLGVLTLGTQHGSEHYPR